MKEVKEIVIWCLLRQVCSIICFVALAIHFEKWWISLFAILFQSGIETHDKAQKKE